MIFQLSQGGQAAPYIGPGTLEMLDKVGPDGHGPGISSPKTLATIKKNLYTSISRYKKAGDPEQVAIVKAYIEESLREGRADMSDSKIVDAIKLKAGKPAHR